MKATSPLDSILTVTSGMTGLRSRSPPRRQQHLSQPRWPCWELAWQDSITVANARSNRRKFSTERPFAICQKEKAADSLLGFFLLMAFMDGCYDFETDKPAL